MRFSLATFPILRDNLPIDATISDLSEKDIISDAIAKIDYAIKGANVKARINDYKLAKAELEAHLKTLS